jgi:hypothetical protein
MNTAISCWINKYEFILSEMVTTKTNLILSVFQIYKIDIKRVQINQIIN